MARAEETTPPENEAAPPVETVDRARLYDQLRGRDEAAAEAAARALSQDPSPATIRALCEALGRQDLAAQEAAHSLVLIGQPAVEALLAALRDPNNTRRWHAAKALAAIASPVAVPALVRALRDDDASVRWEAVYGLSAIGLPALEPLLAALTTEEITTWFAMGAHRVLRRLAPWVPQLRLSNLLRMLEHRQEYISVPLEAFRLLEQLRAGEGYPSLGSGAGGR